jgi:hypothetical protein
MSQLKNSHNPLSVSQQQIRRIILGCAQDYSADAAGDKLGRGAEGMSMARSAGWLCLVKILDFHRASERASQG